MGIEVPPDVTQTILSFWMSKPLAKAANWAKVCSLDAFSLVYSS